MRADSVRPGAQGFWSGIGGGLVFVLVQLLARVLAVVPTLPEIVQDRLVLLLPGPLFAFFLDRLLYLGKPLLFASLLSAEILFAGLMGLAIARSGRPLAVSLVLWLATGLVLLPLAGRPPFDGSMAVAAVELAAAVAYSFAYALFAGLPLGAALVALPAPVRSHTRAASSGHPTAGAAVQLGHTTGSRRRLLAAGGLLGITAAGLAWKAIGTLPELPPRGQEAVPSGGAAAGLPASPLASGAGSAVPGLPPAVTPSDRFYIVSKNLLDPHLNARQWRLEVKGMVSRPLTLSYSDLLAFPSVTTYRTLECISNEVGGDLISNGQWTGVRLADLLQRADVGSGATVLEFASADGYTSDLSLPQALDPTTLLVYRLNGSPLPPKHGYPIRLLSAATYGMKNPKWITEVQLVRAAKPGFWQQQGWNEQGIVQTMAEVTSPHDGATVASGSIQIAGIAFAGARGLQQVEVSTDGGSTWTPATLLPSLGASTWTFWRYTWHAAVPGSYTIAARATDGTGAVQTSRRTDPFPDGATGLDQVRIRVMAGPS